MRSFQRSLLLTSLIGIATLSPHLAADKTSCAVTKPPEHSFVPPAPYPSSAGSNEFLYGTPALWTVVYSGWRVHRGGKLPYFRQGYDWTKEGRPRLTVVARRLDGEASLVWSDLPTSGFIEGRGLAGMFMVTGVDIPSSGCWEIATHYIADLEVQTLTYTVWVSN